MWLLGGEEARCRIVSDGLTLKPVEEGAQELVRVLPIEGTVPREGFHEGGPRERRAVESVAWR